MPLDALRCTDALNEVAILPEMVGWIMQLLISLIENLRA